MEEGDIDTVIIPLVDINGYNNKAIGVNRFPLADLLKGTDNKVMLSQSLDKAGFCNIVKYFEQVQNI